jgi:RHS repeat-associated protein
MNPVSGLMDYRNRTYNPMTGRFGRRDPAGYSNNEWGNLYDYVYENPIIGIDPYGLLKLVLLSKGFKSCAKAWQVVKFVPAPTERNGFIIQKVKLVAKFWSCSDGSFVGSESATWFESWTVQSGSVYVKPPFRRYIFASRGVSHVGDVFKFAVSSNSVKGLFGTFLEEGWVRFVPANTQKKSWPKGFWLGKGNSRYARTVFGSTTAPDWYVSSPKDKYRYLNTR